MNMPHLWRVDRPASDFAALLEALDQAGLKVGWLIWTAPSRVTPELEDAAKSGALRAAAVGEGWSVAVKRLRGAPVPRDVLREHFRGCQLVLVHGDVDLPQLSPSTANTATWTLESGSPSDQDPLSATDLIRQLQRPSPFAARTLGTDWRTDRHDRK